MQGKPCTNLKGKTYHSMCVHYIPRNILGWICSALEDVAALKASSIQILLKLRSHDGRGRDVGSRWT